MWPWSKPKSSPDDELAARAAQRRSRAASTAAPTTSLDGPAMRSVRVDSLLGSDDGRSSAAVADLPWTVPGADASKVGLTEGYLEKQGEVVKSWKRRYFVLVGTTLAWYDSVEAAAAGEAKGQIQCMSVRKAVATKETTIIGAQGRNLVLKSEVGDVGLIDTLKARLITGGGSGSLAAVTDPRRSRAATSMAGDASATAARAAVRPPLRPRTPSRLPPPSVPRCACAACCMHACANTTHTCSLSTARCPFPPPHSAPCQSPPADRHAPCRRCRARQPHLRMKQPPHG